MRQVGLSVLCGAALLLGAAPSAQGAFDDPISGFAPFVPPSKIGSPAPPTGYLEGPCGLAVAANGNYYVSDYYHRAVDIFSSTVYESQPLKGTGPINPHTGPVDDPCGLALGTGGTLYVNNYHSNVVRFPSPINLGTGVVLDSGDPSDKAINPTGVAVNSTTGNVYVDDRTYIAAYDSAGAPLPTPKIGVGTLGDGYGIAVSAYPATAGFVYVPDAAGDTVKVYDPETDTVNPISTIAGPPGGFGSLRDSAVAVDRVSGEIYVLDTRGPQFSELPEATVYVFDAFGVFKGRLKHNVINGAPSGLAVDNSAGATQGRVYVTSGITVKAGIYAYPKGAATSVALPPHGAVAASSPLGGGVEPLGPPAAQATTPPSTERSPASTAGVSGDVQKENPGLPTCPYSKIQPGSSSRALANCSSALVGRGSFAANVALDGREPYPTTGRVLVYNGVKAGKPVLYGHIYSARPVAASFVMVFRTRKVRRGAHGIALYATPSKSMDAWGRLTHLEMTFSRRYVHEGGCGRASFAVDRGRKSGSAFIGPCGTKGDG